LDFGQNVQWLLQEWADRGCLRRVVFASTQLFMRRPSTTLRYRWGARWVRKVPMIAIRLKWSFFWRCCHITKRL
jgi:hypothetical protein